MLGVYKLPIYILLSCCIPLPQPKPDNQITALLFGHNTDGVSEPTQGNFFQIENVQPLFTGQRSYLAMFLNHDSCHLNSFGVVSLSAPCCPLILLSCTHPAHLEVVLNLSVQLVSLNYVLSRWFVCVLRDK